MSEMEEKHYGFYRAIVIQNNDPDRQGRVKLFFPQFSAQIARHYNLDAAKLEARFAGGKNINTFLNSNILKVLKGVLPWSSQASPLIGSGTSGVYDAKNDIATVGEGHSGAEFEPLGEEGINPSGEAVAPKAAYSIHGNSGLFDTGYKTGKCDVLNEAMKPSGINNATKGSFSIPKVGAHVWAFFEEGSLLRPVYSYYIYDKVDWNSVCNPQESNPNLHYPAGSENIEDDGDPFFSTGQTIINTKAGSLEFIETDDLETIKVSHHSGSMLSMGNHYTVDIAIENRRIDTNENEYHSVKGDYVFAVKGENHQTFYGKQFVTYGDMDTKSIYQEWMDKAEPAFAQAALFAEDEIKITDPTTKNPAEKGCPNDKFKHPEQLTLKPTGGSWTNHLTKLIPSQYMTLDQTKVLNVTKS
jgi:hypothetical protein